jgi:hypothetical protein
MRLFRGSLCATSASTHRARGTRLPACRTWHHDKSGRREELPTLRPTNALWRLRFVKCSCRRRPQCYAIPRKRRRRRHRHFGQMTAATKPSLRRTKGRLTEDNLLRCGKSVDNWQVGHLFATGSLIEQFERNRATARERAKGRRSPQGTHRTARPADHAGDSTRTHLCNLAADCRKIVEPAQLRRRAMAFPPLAAVVGRRPLEAAYTMGVRAALPAPQHRTPPNTRDARSMARHLSRVARGTFLWAATTVQCTVTAPQHFLNFLPDPHGQGSLRPILDRRLVPADRFS